MILKLKYFLNWIFLVNVSKINNTKITTESYLPTDNTQNKIATAANIIFDEEHTPKALRSQCVLAKYSRMFQKVQKKKLHHC